jgi:hypothetical protein
MVLHEVLLAGGVLIGVLMIAVFMLTFVDRVVSRW